MDTRVKRVSVGVSSNVILLSFSKVEVHQSGFICTGDCGCPTLAVLGISY